MQPLRFLPAVFSPIALAVAVVIMLKRYGLLSPRVAVVVIILALAVTVLNGIFVVLALTKR